MAENALCLDPTYSTTRRVTRDEPVFENPPDSKLRSMLFLPPSPERQEEGGLRTKSYFKQSLPDMPLISVITVVFNGAQHLEETILSVIHQTYDNVEYIIIDGGSNDRTVDIIKKYEDKIDYWVSEPDRGIYDAMNKGIELTNGEWLNFLNCGDSFFNNYVLSDNISSYKDKTFIYSNTLLIDNNFKLSVKVLNCDHNIKLLIHQSSIYKKILHYYYGKYLVANNFMLSDYLFFSLLPNNVFCKSKYIISKYDINGNSNSKCFNHIKNKLCIDLLLNQLSPVKFPFILYRIYIIGTFKSIIFNVLSLFGAHKFAYKLLFK
jgi:glycosyltransferase involved in cell wall biosynthesis